MIGKTGLSNTDPSVWAGWHRIGLIFMVMMFPDTNNKANMLRITSAEKSAFAVHLIVEGRLIGPWVAELQTAVWSVKPLSVEIHLDLAGVHFVDAAGLDLLHELLDQGVILQDVSPFIRQLLLQ